MQLKVEVTIAMTYCVLLTNKHLAFYRKKVQTTFYSVLNRQQTENSKQKNCSKKASTVIATAYKVKILQNRLVCKVILLPSQVFCRPEH